MSADFTTLVVVTKTTQCLRNPESLLHQPRKADSQQDQLQQWSALTAGFQPNSSAYEEEQTVEYEVVVKGGLVTACELKIQYVGDVFQKPHCFNGLK